MPWAKPHAACHFHILVWLRGASIEDQLNRAASTWPGLRWYVGERKSDVDVGSLFNDPAGCNK